MWSYNNAVLAALVGLAAAGSAAAQQPTQNAQGPAQTITLEQAIEIGLERNPTLQIAENTSDLDAIAVRQQQMAFLPNLSLNTSTSQSYGRTFSQDEGRIINSTTNSLSGGFSSNVTLFNGFSNVASLQQARLNQSAGTQDVSRSKQTVVFTVMANYLALIEQQEQVAVQQENLAAQEAQEAQIKAYVDAGARPISDLYQQQATTASARLGLVQAQRSLELARMALVRTLHLDPLQEYVFQVPTLSDTAATARPVDLRTLATQALAQRPDLAAAQVRVSAAEQGLRIASASRWPTVALSMGYNSGFSSANDDPFFDQIDARRGGSFGLGVSLPVFDRNASRLAKQRASIQVENAQINLENARQTVAIEIRTAALDLQSAQEQLRQAEAQLRAADLALQTTQQRYNVGAANIVELTLARAARVQAASDLVNARYGLTFQVRQMDYYLGNLDVGDDAN
jgi:outer membrane protein